MQNTVGALPSQGSSSPQRDSGQNDNENCTDVCKTWYVHSPKIHYFRGEFLDWRGQEVGENSFQGLHLGPQVPETPRGTQRSITSTHVKFTKKYLTLPFYFADPPSVTVLGGHAYPSAPGMCIG